MIDALLLAATARAAIEADRARAGDARWNSQGYAQVLSNDVPPS